MRPLAFFCWSLLLSARKAAALLTPDAAYFNQGLQTAAGDGWTLQRIAVASHTSRIVHDNLGGLHVVTPRFDTELEPGFEFDYLYYDGSSWAPPETIMSVSPEDLLDNSEFQPSSVQVSLDMEADEDGNPVVLIGYWQTGASGDFLTRSPPTVTIARRDEINVFTWQLDPIADLAEGFDFRIALDAQNAPYISWRAGTIAPYSLVFGKLVDGTWQTKNVDINVGSPGDIAIDQSTGQIFMAYRCNINSLCSATSSDGGVMWDVQEIVTSQSVSVCGGSPCAAALSAKLALDGGGRPHIVHAASVAAVFHTYLDDNGIWQSEQVSNEPATVDVAISISSSGKIGIAWFWLSNYPRTSAGNFVLSEKQGTSWSYWTIWHAGNRGEPSLTYVDEDPVPLFPTSPYYFTTEDGYGAGWSSSQVLELVDPWYANNGFTEENMNPYEFPPRGGGVVAFPVAFANQHAEHDYVVVTTRTAGRSLYLTFDKDGVFQTRMPQGFDEIGNMHTTSKGNLVYTEATAVGDFDGDGLADFIIAGRDTEGRSLIEFHPKADDSNLFLSNILAPPLIIDDTLNSNYPNLSELRDMAAADFDNDGNLDFVIGGQGSEILLYLGNGDGSFILPPIVLTANVIPHGLDTEDIDGDGNPDFAVVGNFYRSDIEIFFGNGLGGFSQSVYELGDLTEAPAQTSQGVALADFDEDGNVDLVITNYAGSRTEINGLAFFKGNGDRTFVPSAITSGPEIGLGTTTLFYARSVDNFYANEDSFMDLIVADSMSGKVFIYLGNGDGTFTLKPQRFFWHPGCGSSGGGLCILDPYCSIQYDHLLLANVLLQDISTKPYSELVPPTIVRTIDSIDALSTTLMSIQDVLNGANLALQIAYTGFDIDEILIDWNCDGTSETAYADLGSTTVNGVETVMLPPPAEIGVFSICVNSVEAPFHVVVYDPLDKSFTTGSGKSDSGTGTFNFVVRYDKKSGQPTGKVLFEWDGGVSVFEATSFDWLIVSGELARCEGSGSVNGTGTIRFLLTAEDSKANSDDRFRIQIIGDTLVYDDAAGQECAGTEEGCPDEYAPQIASGNVLVQDLEKRMLRERKSM